MTFVTVFLGAGGGAGTSSSALAAARRLAGRVLLLDLDVWSGTLAAQVGLDPTVSLADLAAVELADIDGDAIAAVSWRVDGGLELIPAPSRPELADVIDPQLVEAVFELIIAGNQYDAIVVDAGSRLDLTTWHACMRADRLVICSRRSTDARVRVGNLLDVLSRSHCAAQVEHRRSRTFASYQLAQLTRWARRNLLVRQSSRPGAGAAARGTLPIGSPASSSMRGG